jgi:hypothetical protein
MATKVVFEHLVGDSFYDYLWQGPHKANGRAKIVHRQSLENAVFLEEHYSKG